MGFSICFIAVRMSHSFRQGLVSKDSYGCVQLNWFLCCCKLMLLHRRHICCIILLKETFHVLVVWTENTQASPFEIIWVTNILWASFVIIQLYHQLHKIIHINEVLRPHAKSCHFYKLICTKETISPYTFLFHHWNG